MIRSIRVRIGLTVLVTTVGLLGVQGLWTLRQLEKTGREEVDAYLQAELGELTLLLGTPQLDELIATEIARRGRRDEVMFEIRSEDGRLLVGSPNLPEAGLGPFRTQPGRVRYWERLHPASHEGHRRIRVAELEQDGHRFRVAQSLLGHQKRYWDFREDLLLGLTIIGLFASGIAWLVATRALSPVGRMIDRAAELETEREGLLPGTGKGDELDRLAVVLNHLLSSLRDQVERTRRLSADASHALRTPLTTIRGNLELLASQQPSSEPVQQALQQVERLHRMVDGLLTLERLEMRGLPGELEPVELDALVEELATDFRLAAAEKGVSLETELAPARVRGHERSLREAVANLVDNAIRHAPAGGRVEITLARHGDRICVTVADDGAGFEAGEAERLFDRFYSIGASGTGTGLGLAITRATARAHGGDAWASASAAGAVFTLELPACDGPPAAVDPSSH